MKANLTKFFSGLLLVLCFGLFALTNTGILSFEKPYIYRFSRELPVQDSLVAFVHVNVIPMDSERVMENQTVLVRDGWIERIGHSDRMEVPREASVIDGRGKYLMPGLVDMHVHIENPDDLLLFVANGVTSVRNMWGNTDKKLQFGFPDQLELRQQIEVGELFGPRIYTAGPILEGSRRFIQWRKYLIHLMRHAIRLHGRRRTDMTSSRSTIIFRQAFTRQSWKQRVSTISPLSAMFLSQLVWMVSLRAGR
jgi:hypothetical protein